MDNIQLGRLCGLYRYLSLAIYYTHNLFHEEPCTMHHPNTVHYAVVGLP